MFLLRTCCKAIASFVVVTHVGSVRGAELCVTELLFGETALSLCGDPPFHITTAGVSDETLIPVSEPDVLVVTWNENYAGTLTPFYAVTRDGTTFEFVRPTSYDLRMRYATFDPGVESVSVASELSADPSCTLHVVQFVAPSMPEFRAAIANAGATVRGFLVNHAHLVEMDDAAKALVEALPYVRAVTPYHPAFRLEPYLRDNLDNAETLFPLQRYNIMVGERGMAQKQIVADRITQLGGTIDRLTAGGFLLEATLTPEQLLEVAAYNEVVYVDRWAEIEELMDVAREVSGGNYVADVTIPGYTGQGVRGEVIDTTLRETHVAFQSRPPIKLGIPGGPPWHGTEVYGTIFGDGTGAPIEHPEIPPGRGMMPDAQGIFQSAFTLGQDADHCHACKNFTDDCADVCTSSDPAAPYEGVFQSRSVVSGFTTLYTTRSAEIDDVAFTYDVLMCQAQGNCGNTVTPSDRCLEACGTPANPQCAGPEAWAKNVVSVGGVYHAGLNAQGEPDFGNEDPADDHAQGTGDFYGPLEWPSIGPAADGRMKPDLAHFYDDILTTQWTGDEAYERRFAGTSVATPITCGHFGLFHQMWSDGIFGNAFNPTASVFDNRPHATTAKAMMINTAKPYIFNEADLCTEVPEAPPCGEQSLNDDITRAVQGWGVPNVKKLYNLAYRGAFLLIVNEADVLSVGRRLYTVNVPEDAFSLKITLVYADPAGNPASAIARVNDLGVWAYHIPSGPLGPYLFHGNMGLTESNWSAAGGSSNPNDVDTVENIFVKDPPEGDWEIAVSVYELNADGHLETSEFDIDYALVVSVDFDCDGNRVADSEETEPIAISSCPTPSGGGPPTHGPFEDEATPDRGAEAQ